jgi:glycosyltransferase involved in cell wall biosynthesis
MKRKLETNSHAPEFIKDWYDKVWNRWQFQMRNLHPVTPQQYQIAVEENITTLPAALQLHIKKERMIVKGHRRLCSIIVLNWNSCELLKRCIQLIIDTTTNYELIVVDNGSTKDDSVEYINSIVCKKVFNKENLGFAGGVNSGLKVKAKNSDVCLLNVDAEVQQGWLENLYETLMKYPTCGLVGPLGNEVASGYQKEGYVEEDTEVANLHGFCMLIMKEVYDKIGLFDERFKLGGYDDNDYGMRTLIAGWTLYLSAKSLVRHKAHQVFKLNGLDYLDIDPINNEVFKNKIYNILLNYSKIFDLYQYEDLARFVKLKI